MSIHSDTSSDINIRSSNKSLQSLSSLREEEGDTIQ